jgi:asparagine synthase (glutamine-hydrolysing)
MHASSQSTSAGFVKHRGTYVFKIDRQGHVTTANQPTLCSDDQKTWIFLNGVIYNHSGAQLVEGFISHGVDYVDRVEGSFIIFFMDGKQFHILTDKTHSKKAFLGFIDNAWHVSNDIDLLPTGRCQLSLDGIACYLANVFMLEDLTLFRGIRSTRRASVHTLRDAEMKSYPYWEFKFTDPAYSFDQYRYYEEEFRFLLIESVKRIYSAVSMPVLSLSAGHDSRTILGILRTEIEASGLSCFSYAMEPLPSPQTDAALSKTLAERCGYPHQTIQSYEGDLISHLKHNAREGKCLSNFSEELDAWNQLASETRFSDIIVGDKCFGKAKIKSGSRPDILASVFIRDAAAIHWLANFISKTTYRQMCQCIDELTDTIFEKTNDIYDPLEKSHFLYFDQRIDHFIMPWRENFTGQVGFVHNPFLDSSVLDFIQRLPFQLRKGKFLYINTVKNMFPDLFSLGTAASSGYQVDWAREVRMNKDGLISLIQSTNSRLDELISKNEVLDAIIHCDSWILNLKEYPIKAINFLRRIKFVDHALAGVIGTRYRSKGSLVGSNRLLIRLLLIWIYLSPPSPDS